MEAVEIARAVPKYRVDPDLGAGAVEPESPDCARWLSIEPLNQVLETLLGAVEALLKIAEPLIGFRRLGPAMSTK